MVVGTATVEGGQADTVEVEDGEVEEDGKTYHWPGTGSWPRSNHTPYPV